jgi:hypothetical protein
MASSGWIWQPGHSGLKYDGVLENFIHIEMFPKKI